MPRYCSHQTDRPARRKGRLNRDGDSIFGETGILLEWKPDMKPIPASTYHKLKIHSQVHFTSKVVFGTGGLSLQMRSLQHRLRSKTFSQPPQKPKVLISRTPRLKTTADGILFLFLLKERGKRPAYLTVRYFPLLCSSIRLSC